MPSTAIAPETFALFVQPDGRFRLLHWGTVRTPEHALCCDTARPVDLTTQLTMWIDQDYPELCQQINRPAMALVGLFRPEQHQQLLTGDVVFTGTTDAHGHALGLTEAQAVLLIGRYLERPANLPPQQRP
ncbi:DUF3846 domain-containing protein [Streptomyces sp. NPDC021100]|uniref:DUF3846 domain-containing protein n=1 Tax=Streptomyces sp. NPDC021100 TaxID=3365114 RepID=UPI00379C4925